MDASRTVGLAAIPAYNEAPTLSTLISAVRRELPGLDLLVIDDGSTDGTAAVLRELGVRSARHLCNLGYGRSIQTALRCAMVEGYEFVVTIDGDGQHPPDQARHLLDHFQQSGVDLCIGSRFVSTGRYGNTPWDRRLGMWTFSWLARLVTGRRFYDTTSGLKVIRRTIFGALTRWHFVDFHAEAIVYLTRLGFSVTECPVVMAERTHGQSMYSIAHVFTYPMKTALMVAIATVQAALTRKAAGR